MLWNANRREEKKGSGGDVEGWRDGGTEHGALQKEGGRRRQRAVVDITAVIHLSDSLPNALLGDTQSCVIRNAANGQCKHTCTHMQRKSMPMYLSAGWAYTQRQVNAPFCMH